MNLSTDFKKKVAQAILENRKNYGGSDANFAKTLGIKAAIYSRLKSGETEGILSDTKWITFGRMYNVRLHDNNWKVARTSVYVQIEDNLNFCQQLSKSMILADDCGIGKTFCTKHIIRTMKNAFYVDCSQAKTATAFISLLAKTVGVEPNGRYIDVKANLKYYLNILDKPIVVLDEAGDLNYRAFLELKELWNGTDGSCGWYMMGADGLRDKINRGIRNHMVGYAEIFSRFSDDFVRMVPSNPDERKEFMINLIGSVATVNTEHDEKRTNLLIRKCLNKDASLRYLETLIKIGA